MTTRVSEPRVGPPAGHDPGLQPPVVRRAHQLCVRAEPHAEQAPCQAHIHEATRQFGANRAVVRV